MKWEKYLELEGFKDDIVHGLERQTRAVISGHTETTRQVVVAQQQGAREATRALDRGFGSLVASQEEMMSIVENGFADIYYGLDRVAEGIEGLRADFDWAMSAVLWKIMNPKSNSGFISQPRTGGVPSRLDRLYVVGLPLH